MKRLLLISLVLLSACGAEPESAEDELRAWLERGEAAVEDRNRTKLLDMISERYADANGNDRESIGQLLRLQFLRQDDIALLTSVESIELYDTSAAELQLTVGMAGRNRSRFGFSADAYRFVFELEREDADWRLVSARWSELGQPL
jgi:hypothetical protein